jgi:transposase InsO family protein
MKTTMNDQALKTPAEVRLFLTVSTGLNFSHSSQQEKYAWLEKTLKRFGYLGLGKKDKGSVFAYCQKMTSYSRQHLTRLVGQYRKTQRVGGTRKKRNQFETRYTRADILRLAETDEQHQHLSGGATKKLFERAHEIFDDKGYERLAGISIAHLYNLRKTFVYRDKRRHFEKTQRTAVSIGERRKPAPNGSPGYLRIDTVHQGDQDGEKGVYHINAVDEVTQMEIVSSVEKISEHYLIPVLEMLIDTFPFEIKGIHTDNGSEYINYTVVKLLNKLLIELTKSRSRHSNDNALAESKNGSIVRKHLGYMHIPQKYASRVNEFLKEYLNPYINFHRPCYFVEVKLDAKGKERKVYPYERMMTPYEKLKSLANAAQYLKPQVTFETLDKEAMQLTDLAAAKRLKQAREALFKEVTTRRDKIV